MDLAPHQVWEIGQANVLDMMSTPTKSLYGRADILASLVENNGLRVEPDNNPPRHADIIGWPQDRGERKSIAQKLAAGATLILRSLI